MKNKNINSDWIVYMITNPEGRIYIGRTSKIKVRLSYYKGLHCGRQKELYNSLIQYGFMKHKLEIIDEFSGTKAEADEKEAFWINFHKSCINIWPENKGLNLSPGGSGIGIKRTEKQRNLYYKKRSIEVSQFDLDGNFIRKYRSMRDAANGSGCNKMTVCHAIKYRNGKSRKFIFKKTKKFY